ncbi:hypothetical protein HK096_004969, partial [Nowakowskiella sp. JEL0078]
MVRLQFANRSRDIWYQPAVAVFGCAAAMLGPWLERNGPFKGVLLGASLFYAGNLLAGLGVFTKQMWLVYIGYGIVAGMGLGIGYIAPVSPLQKFFPEMRGIAAGLAVCGFGGGSIIAPFTQLALIGSSYTKDLNTVVGVPLTFVILGSCYFVIMILAGSVLRMPPPGYQVKGITIDTIAGAENISSVPGSGTQTLTNKDPEAIVEETSVVKKDPFAMTLPNSLGSREFWLMYCMFFGSQIAGLLMISKIQSIAINQLGQTALLAAYYNSGLSAMNLFGRLLLPTISDFIGRKPLFILSLAVQAVLVGYIPDAIHQRSFSGVITSAFIIGLFYGGGFGMIPAFLSDQFGSKNVGATHGVILTSWSLTGVVGAIVFNTILASENTRLQTGTPEGKPNLIYIYDIDMRWVLVIILIMFIVCLFIPVNIRDRKLPKVEGEVMRFRFVNGRMIRVMKGFKFVYVSKESEEGEWNAVPLGIRKAHRALVNHRKHKKSRRNAWKQANRRIEAKRLQNDACYVTATFAMLQGHDSLVLDAADYIASLSLDNQESLLEILLRKASAPVGPHLNTNNNSWPRIVSLVQSLHMNSSAATSLVDSPLAPPTSPKRILASWNLEFSPVRSSPPDFPVDSVNTLDGLVLLRPLPDLIPILEVLRDIQQNVLAMNLYSDLKLPEIDLVDFELQFSSKISNHSPIHAIEFQLLTLLTTAPAMILNGNRQLIPSHSHGDSNILLNCALSISIVIESLIFVQNEETTKYVHLVGKKNVGDEIRSKSEKLADAFVSLLNDVIRANNVHEASIEQFHYAKAVYAALIFDAHVFVKSLKNFVEFCWDVVSPIHNPAEPVVSKNARELFLSYRNLFRDCFIEKVNMELKCLSGQLSSTSDDSGYLSDIKGMNGSDTESGNSDSNRSICSSPKNQSVLSRKISVLIFANKRKDLKPSISEISNSKKSTRRNSSQILQRPSTLNYKLRLVPNIENNQWRAKHPIQDVENQTSAPNQWTKLVENIGIPYGFVQQTRKAWEESRKPEQNSAPTSQTSQPEDIRLNNVRVKSRYFEKHNEEMKLKNSKSTVFHTQATSNTYLKSKIPQNTFSDQVVSKTVTEKNADLKNFSSISISEIKKIDDEAFFSDNLPLNSSEDELKMDYSPEPQSDASPKPTLRRKSKNLNLPLEVPKSRSPAPSIDTTKGKSDSSSDSESSAISPVRGSPVSNVPSPALSSPYSNMSSPTLNSPFSNLTSPVFSTSSTAVLFEKKHTKQQNGGSSTHSSGNSLRETSYDEDFDAPQRLVKFNDDSKVQKNCSPTKHRRVQSLGHKSEVVSKHFESLRTVSKLGIQKMPTFDSQGRRIGIYNHGKFSSETEHSESEEDLPLTSGFVSVKGNLLHLSEDNHDVLVMEMISGKLQIVGGTLEKILLRLADENVQDQEYVDIVLQSHHFFISSRDLLENLCTRFRIEPPQDPTEEDIAYFNKWRKSIQLKALTVIGRWLKIQFEDFENDEVLKDTLEDFLEEVWESRFRNEVERIRRTAQNQASSISMRSAVAPFPPYMLNLPPPLPILPQPNSSRFLPPLYFYPPPPRNPILNRPAPYPRYDSPNLLESSPLLEMDSRDLAKYLTAADCAAFNSISTADYISKLLDSNEPLLKESLDINSSERNVSPVHTWMGRIELFTVRANMIRNWVAIEICSVNKIKARRRIIEKFIAVAKICRELNNFQTLLFIVSGLLSNPVQRLKKTWEGVTNRSTLTLLEKLLDPTGNMKNYRKALNSSKQPTIPFFPVVMKDLTFIIEGNSSTTQSSAAAIRNSSDTFVSSKPSELETTMINLDKYRTLVNTMKFYMDMSRTQKYQFEHLLLPTLKYIPSALYGPASYSFSVMDELNQLKLVDNTEIQSSDEGEEGDGEDVTECEDNDDESIHEGISPKKIGKVYCLSTSAIQTEDEEEEINNSSVLEFDEEEILRRNSQNLRQKVNNLEKLQQQLQDQYYKAHVRRGKSANNGFISKQFGKSSFNKSVMRTSIASTINYNQHNHSGNKNLNTNLNFFGGNTSEHGRSDCMTVEKLAYIVESRIAFADDELPGFWPEGGNAMAAALVMAGRVE